MSWPLRSSQPAPIARESEDQTCSVTEWGGLFFGAAGAKAMTSADAASGLAGSLACDGDGRPRSHGSRVTLSVANRSADPRCQRGEPNGEMRCK